MVYGRSIYTLQAHSVLQSLIANARDNKTFDVIACDIAKVINCSTDVCVYNMIIMLNEILSHYGISIPEQYFSFENIPNANDTSAKYDEVKHLLKYQADYGKIVKAAEDLIASCGRDVAIYQNSTPYRFRCSF